MPALPILAVLACLGSPGLMAQQYVTGYSSIAVSQSVVLMTGYTEIDYTSVWQGYYVETDVLPNGATTVGASQTGAPSVTASYTLPAAANQNYSVQTNHWIYIPPWDPGGFSTVGSGTYYQGFTSTPVCCWTNVDGDYLSLVGITWNSTSTVGTAPTITSVDQTSNGNGRPGTGGYVTVNGNALSATWSASPVAIAIPGISAQITNSSYYSMQVYYYIPTGTLVGARTATVTTPYGSATFAFQVTGPTIPQTISFPQPPTVTYGVAPFTVSATASSGLPIVFSSSTAAVCTVSGSTVTVVGGGTCTIHANQAGDFTRMPAPDTPVNITVLPVAQTISFAALPGVTFGATPFVVSATATSHLAVVFSSDTVGLCTVSGSLVSIVAGGSCTIRAKQAGNATFLAAVDVPQTFTVAPGSQTINFPVPASPTVGQVPRGLSATASSGLPVAFVSLTGSICTAALVGSVYQLSALVPGNCTIQASQAGNASYAAAPLVTRTFPVMDANVVTVIESPASNATVFGTFGVRGYALENSPGSTAVKIAGVALTITAQDGGTSPAVTGTATFGQVARQDICNPQTGSYPGGSDCPKVQFDYTWQTGLTTDWTALLPNGVYQVTATATNNAPGPSSGSASVLVNVDNQPPSPLIVSPINGDGVYNTNQTFTVNFVSPHNSGDIGSGQIVFAQSPTLECTVQFLGGGAVYLLPGSQACVLSNASVTAADAYSLAVKVTVSFPAAMLGQLSVQAYGTDEQGHAGPLTEVTKFTVTGVPVPALMSAGSSSFLVQSYQWTQGVQPVVLVNGAVGPVTVSGTQILYPQYCPGYLVGPQASMTGAQTATLVSYGYVPYNSCLFATYNLSAPGLAPVLNAVYYGAALNPYFNIGVRQVLYSVPQGGSVTVPVTFTPAMGYSGPVQLGVYAPPGIAASWDVSGVSLDGVNGGSGNLTLAVDPGLARGTYAVMIPGGPYAGNSGYLFVTVTPNTVPDFVLSPITSVSVTAGQAVSFSARVVPVAGFGGAVTVLSPGVADQVGIPGSAISLAVSPQTTPPLAGSGQTVSVTVNSTAVTANGTYSIPITAQSGSIAHSTSVSLTVHGGTAPDFHLSGPLSLSVHSGIPATSMITLQPIAGFSGPVTISSASVPAGLVPLLTVNGLVVTQVPLSTTGSIVGVSLSVAGPPGVSTGTYRLTVEAAGGGVQHSVQVTVAVTPAPTISISFPSFQSVQIGQHSSFPVSVSTQNYTGGPITISATFLPVGVTIAPVTVQPGATTAIVTVSASSAAAPNRYAFYLGATAGAVSASPQTVVLTIPHFVITPTSLQQIQPGGSTTARAKVAGVLGYSGPISLAYTPGNGVSAAGPSTANPGDTLLTGVFATTTALAGDYATMTATDSAGLSASIPIGAYVSRTLDPTACNGAVFNSYLYGPDPDPYTTGVIGFGFGADVTQGPSPSGWTSTVQNAFTYTNLGCTIHLAPWDYLGALSNGGHTVTYPDAQWVWIGYDVTPVITSLDPDTVPPGPATITIGGYGFGDRPTVIVGSPSAPIAVLGAGTPSGAAPDESGNPTITVSFAIPDSYLHSTMPIMVQSGGQRGIPYQQVAQSKPRSQPVQLGITSETATCGDQRDTLIAQYAAYVGPDGAVHHVSFSPQCEWFTQTFQSQFFSFDELRDKLTVGTNGPRKFDWALLRAPLAAYFFSAGLDRWRLLLDADQQVNSGYRTPENNFGTPGAASNSRHMFGDAVDLKNNTATKAEWEFKACRASATLAGSNGAICAAGQFDAGADFVEPLSGPCRNNCVHADWRWSYKATGAVWDYAH